MRTESAHPRSTVYVGDARQAMREAIAPGSVQCVVTSPPYWSLRDYGIAPVEWENGVSIAAWDGGFVGKDFAAFRTFLNRNNDRTIENAVAVSRQLQCAAEELRRAIAEIRGREPSDETVN